MEKVTENPNFETKNLPPPNHQMDADDDDENVKQLKECSSLNLSLQVFVSHLLFDSSIFYTGFILFDFCFGRIVLLIAIGTGNLVRNVRRSLYSQI